MLLEKMLINKIRFNCPIYSLLAALPYLVFCDNVPIPLTYFKRKAVISQNDEKEMDHRKDIENGKKVNID